MSRTKRCACSVSGLIRTPATSLIDPSFNAMYELSRDVANVVRSLITCRSLSEIAISISS